MLVYGFESSQTVNVTEGFVASSFNVSGGIFKSFPALSAALKYTAKSVFSSNSLMSTDALNVMFSVIVPALFFVPFTEAASSTVVYDSPFFVPSIQYTTSLIPEVSSTTVPSKI